MTQAKGEASLAEVEDIDWDEGKAEDLPFKTDFDVVLSSFGHMLLSIQKYLYKKFYEFQKEVALLHFQHGLLNF